MLLHRGIDRAYALIDAEPVVRRLLAPRLRVVQLLHRPLEPLHLVVELRAFVGAEVAADQVRGVLVVLLALREGELLLEASPRSSLEHQADVELVATADLFHDPVAQLGPVGMALVPHVRDVLDLLWGLVLEHAPDHVGVGARTLHRVLDLLIGVEPATLCRERHRPALVASGEVIGDEVVEPAPTRDRVERVVLVVRVVGLLQRGHVAARALLRLVVDARLHRLAL